MSFTESLKELVATSSDPLLGKHSTWRRVPLSHIADVLNGFPFESHKFTHEATKGFPLIRIRDVVRGETDTYYIGGFDDEFLVVQGDLLVGMDGDFNIATWKGRRGLLNQRVCKINLRTKLFDRRFLVYVLPGYLAAINAKTSSVTVKHLSSRTLLDIPLPLPPLNEQRRIADVLDELLSDLDVAVAVLERVKAKLSLFRASVLKAAVEGSLTPEWRAKHPQVEPASELLARILVERRRRWEEKQLQKFNEVGTQFPKNWQTKYSEAIPPETKELPILPTSWCWASLDQLTEVAGGVTKGQKFSSTDRTQMVPYLRVANVQQGFLDLREIKEIRALESDIKTLRLLPGDVLFNEGGDRDKLGRGWVWGGQLAECVHQNHVFRARPLRPDVQSKILSWCGNSYGREWFMKAGKQSVNLASINLTVLRSFPIALPPAKEQLAIIEAVEDQSSVTDHLTVDLDQKIVAAQALRQAILKYAFGGRLVPRDPHDEPASELLKRIAAERDARAVGKPSRRPSRERRKRQRRNPTTDSATAAVE